VVSIADALSDYGFSKSADATSLNSASLTGFPAYVKLESGTDSTGTGVGVLDSSASINGKEDIGFFDENDNPLDFYWARFDAANGIYEAWVLTDLVRDGGTELKVGYGDGSSDDTSTETTVWDGVSDIVSRFSPSGSFPIEDSTSTGNTLEATTGGEIITDGGPFGDALKHRNNDLIEDQSPSGLPVDDESRSSMVWMKSQHDSGDDKFGNIWAWGDTSGNSNTHWRTIFDQNANSSGDIGIIGQGNDIKFFGSIDETKFNLVASDYDSPNSQVDIYIDDTEVGGGSPSDYNTGLTGMQWGNRPQRDTNETFVGLLAEWQIYSAPKGDAWWQTMYDISPDANYVLFSWNASQANATQVSATPALGQGTPTTAQTTGILGNWRAFKDARITERTQVKVEGNHAQKWEIDASKTTAERAVYRAEQTLDLDMSTAFGTTSGGFTQGTIGWHIRIDDTAILRSTDALQLRVGSSPGDYAVWTLDRNELGPNGEYKYLTFSHDEYDSVVGTPDWTNVDFFELTMFESSGNTTDTFIYVDYLTVSDRDDVGATGIGDRRSDKEQIRSGD